MARLRSVEEALYLATATVPLAVTLLTVVGLIPLKLDYTQPFRILWFAVGTGLVSGLGLAAFMAVRVTGRYVLEGLARLAARLEAVRRSSPYRLGPLRLANPYGFLFGLAVAGEASTIIAWSFIAKGLLYALAATPSLAAGLWLIFRSLYTPAVRVSRARTPWWIVAGGLRPFWRLAAWLDARLGLSSTLQLAGLPITKREAVSMLSTALLASTSLAAALTPMLILLGYAAWTSLALALPIMALLGFKAYAKTKLAERARLAEEEHPYVSFWMWLMVSGGGADPEAALIEAFNRRSLLPGTWLEGLYAHRGLSFVAERQPSKTLRDFYRFVDAVKAGGGDLASYLEQHVWRSLGELSARLENYAHTATNIGTLIVTFMGLGVPLALAMTLLSPAAGLAVIASTAAALPPMAIAFYLTLASRQPRLRERYGDILGLALGSTLALVPPLLALIGLLEPGSHLAYASLALASLGYYLAWRSQRAVVEAEERGLPDVLRVVVEYVKMGYPIPQALAKAADRANPILAERLRSAAAGMVEARSWLLRYVLETLNLMARYGAASPAALEALVRLVDLHQSSWRRARMTLRQLELTAYAVVAASMAAINVIGFIAGRYAAYAAALGFAPGLGVLSMVAELARTVTVVAAAGMGLLVSKAIDLTMRNTLRPLLTVLAALAADYASRLLLGMI